MSWTRPPEARWQRPGTVRVRGEAVDPLGQTHRATAVITVDTFSSTLAGRAKAYVGGPVDLPATVIGVGDRGGQFALPAAREVGQVVTYFYRDGANLSFAESLRVQLLQGGSWVDASGEVPVGTEGSPAIDVVTAAGPVTAIRVVMTAPPGGYITLSEIEVYANAPGVSSDPAAASIEVDGAAVAGFEPGRTGYEVATRQPHQAAVAVTPRDPYATVAIDRQRERVAVTVTSEDGCGPGPTSSTWSGASTRGPAPATAPISAERYGCVPYLWHTAISLCADRAVVGHRH